MSEVGRKNAATTNDIISERSPRAPYGEFCGFASERTCSDAVSRKRSKDDRQLVMRYHPNARNQRTSEALFVLIPCKGLKSGKTRLSSRLNDKSRHALCADLLSHTLKRSLEVVARSQIAVVTSEEDAAELANGYNVGVIADPGKGLNAALGPRSTHVLASNDPYAPCWFCLRIFRGSMRIRF